ncbi:MAG: hypothetical protein IT427_19130, partial [Pirellulales bacterium]|nr:hypothetical protein [Pirellulales bacterium]
PDPQGAKHEYDETVELRRQLAHKYHVIYPEEPGGFWLALEGLLALFGANAAQGAGAATAAGEAGTAAKAGEAAGCAVKGASSTPKPSPKFVSPTNPAQVPPAELPPGIRIFRGQPTQQYPNGYWKIEKFDGNGWQRLDPRTMKPGPHPDTHIPFPDGYIGPFDN